MIAWLKRKKSSSSEVCENHESVNGTSLPFDDDVAQKSSEDIRREFELDYEKQSDGDKRRALQSIHRLLRPGGYLFLGHADIAFTPEGFDTVRENGVTFYRKKV